MDLRIYEAKYRAFSYPSADDVARQSIDCFKHIASHAEEKPPALKSRGMIFCQTSLWIVLQSFFILLLFFFCCFLAIGQHPRFDAIKNLLELLSLQ